jgi:hypothetical protein
MNNGEIMAVNVGKPLQNLLDVCYESRVTPLLIGPTGVGKSSILQQFCAQKGIGFICRDLSIMEPPDLVGLPTLKNDRTHFLPPSFLPTDGEGLLVFEELNRAPSYMRAPCLQLLTARTLNDYVLPQGWLMAAAINPSIDGYDVAGLDLALLSRFVQIHVRADRQEWLAWARTHGVPNQVIAYVESDVSVFDAPTSNPRAWVSVSALLKGGERLEASKLLLQVLVTGCVGPERGLAFCRFLADPVQPLSARDVLAAYGKHQKTLQRWVARGKLDLVEGTLLNVEKHLQSSVDFDSIRANSASWKRLGQFLKDLPGDLRANAEDFFNENEYPLPNKSRRPT